MASLSYIKNNQPDLALNTINKLIITDEKSIYTDYLLFKISLLFNDIALAQNYLNKIYNSLENPFFVLNSQFEFAEYFFMHANYITAKNIYAKIITMEINESNFYQQSLKRLVEIGLILEDKTIFKKYYALLIQYYPQYLFDEDFSKEIKRVFGNQIKVSGILQKESDFFIFCENLLKQKYYNEAIYRAKEFLILYPYSKYKDRIYNILGLAYYQIYEFAKAINYLKLAINNYQDTNFYYKNVFYLARSYQRSKKYNEAKKYFNLIINQYENDEYRPQSFYFLYSVFKKLNLQNEYVSYLDKFKDQYGRNIFYNQLIWEIGWVYTREKNWQKAIETFAKYSALSRDFSLQSKILFWQGKSYLQLKQKNKAEEVFNKCVEKYPFSYSSYRICSNFLPKANVNKVINKISVTESTPIAQYLWLYSAGLGDLAIQELQYKLSKKEKLTNKEIYTFAYLHNKQKNYYQSIKTIRTCFNLNIYPQQDIDIPVEFYKLLYPIAYKPVIDKYADEYSFDTNMVLGLIREESLFNNVIRSRVAATGLMQIMPSTAKEIAKKLGEPWSNHKILEDENLNIKYGIYYLAKLKRAFNGNDFFMLSAYNAGPNITKRWREYFGESDMDFFVARIPYKETQNYIHRVFESSWIYNILYNNEKNNKFATAY